MKNSSLKYIGALAMVVDHVGLAFFPGIGALRIIGRLALPIFAGELSAGYGRTKDFWRYFFRLLVFAVCSQLPFTLFTGLLMLNVLFSLAAALLFLRSMDKKRYWLAALVAIAVLLIPFDSGAITVALAYIFHVLAGRNKILALLLGSAAGLAFAWLSGLSWFVFSFLGVAVWLFFPKEKIPLSAPRYFFYWFYPLHLFVLFLVRVFLGY